MWLQTMAITKRRKIIKDYYSYSTYCIVKSYIFACHLFCEFKMQGTHFFLILRVKLSFYNNFFRIYYLMEELQIDKNECMQNNSYTCNKL